MSRYRRGLVVWYGVPPACAECGRNATHGAAGGIAGFSRSVRDPHGAGTDEGVGGHVGQRVGDRDAPPPVLDGALLLLIGVGDVIKQYPLWLRCTRQHATDPDERA